MYGKSFMELYEYVASLEIIDTHEHLPPTERSYVFESDVLAEYLKHYFISDLISAGFDESKKWKIYGKELSVTDKWSILEPFWERSRNTGYARCLDIAVQSLYGLERIERETIQEINSRFLHSRSCGFYTRILHDKCKIKRAILDTNVDFLTFNYAKEYDSLFKVVLTVDPLMYPKSKQHLEYIESFSGIKPHTFEAWLLACENMLTKAASYGAVALKCGIAYQRPLRFSKAAMANARKAFENMIPKWLQGDFSEISFDLQDFLLYHILEIADSLKIPVQIHTGLQEGNGNLIANSNPELLNNLFIDFPNVDFILFHIGYPYHNVLSALAKIFPNVYIDMCWAHIISPIAAVNALQEWLCVVPSNKIFGFGGDYAFLDGIVGHQYIARQNIAKSLALLVEDGCMNIVTAKAIAKRLLIDNPAELYHL